VSSGWFRVEKEQRPRGFFVDEKEAVPRAGAVGLLAHSRCVPLVPPPWYSQMGFIAGVTVGVLGASAAVVGLFYCVSQRRARVEA